MMDTTPAYDVLPSNLGEMLEVAFEYMAVFVDLVGIGLILFGFFVTIAGTFATLRDGTGLKSPLSDMRPVRETLGVYILFGLEIMIVSDILHTAISRNYANLLEVGLLVLIRTAIGFFLSREVTEVATHK